MAAWLCCAPSMGFARGMPLIGKAAHDLRASIDVAAQSIEVRDTIRLVPGERRGDALLRLFSGARILEFTVNGATTEPEQQNDVLRVPLPETPGEVVLQVRYVCTYDAPPPDMPASFDNPGFGVSGVISPKGVFLMAGSGWHPWVYADRQGFSCEISAPKGVYAVTFGKPVGLEDTDTGSVSRWQVEDAREPLPLCAAPYGVETLEKGATPEIMTFFSQANAELSKRYLDATARHLRFYDKLHGAYAFPKFAVVENFFPTGYGFPSFTLLGRRVLRLPFIPETSLRHEIAHCWWGNGVLVDYDQGNWCEGLTTYVADYLAKEGESSKEAREYRLQVLRDYAQLAAGERDLPLREFASRTSAATRAVGYGKAMFVFHMLRSWAGDDAFWQALRVLYAERLFKPTSWADIGGVFVRSTSLEPRDMDAFLKQWVDRKGAPSLKLGNVSLERAGDKWKVCGVLEQDLPEGGEALCPERAPAPGD